MKDYFRMILGNSNCLHCLIFRSGLALRGNDQMQDVYRSPNMLTGQKLKALNRLCDGICKGRYRNPQYCLDKSRRWSSDRSKRALRALENSESQDQWLIFVTLVQK